MERSIFGASFVIKHAVAGSINRLKSHLISAHKDMMPGLKVPDDVKLKVQSCLAKISRRKGCSE